MRYRTVFPSCVAIVLAGAACTPDSNDGTLTIEPVTAAASPTTPASPIPVATAVTAVTATAGPPTVTVLQRTLPVQPQPMYDVPPVRDLAAGDVVEVDAQRFGYLRLADGSGWITGHPALVDLSFDLEDLPEIVVATHDPSTRTGSPEVDAVIDAVLAVDVDALLSLAAFRDVECVDQGDTGDFICPDGLPRGRWLPSSTSWAVMAC